MYLFFDIEKNMLVRTSSTKSAKILQKHKLMFIAKIQGHNVGVSPNPLIDMVQVDYAVKHITAQEYLATQI